MTEQAKTEAAPIATRAVRVEFTCKVPDTATPQEIGEWLRCRLGVSGDLATTNSLADLELAAQPNTFGYDLRRAE